MAAFHTWPSAHCHQTVFLLPAVTCCGVSAPLSVGCHSVATPGQSVARSFSPAEILRSVQYGQPAPDVRDLISARHDPLPGTDRASPLSRRAGVDNRLPCVTMLTLPPYAPMAATCHCFRRQRQVCLCVPLLQQIRSIILNTIIV